MTLFISKLMNGIMELLKVSVIPFITWLIWSRKKVGFFDWIGLKKVESQKKRRLLLTILGISLLFLLFSIVVFSWFDSFFFQLWSLVGLTLAKRPQQLFLEREWQPFQLSWPMLS